MRFWAGVTDNRWFQFVSSRDFDEVNFWQPGGRPPFSNLPEGTPFLFKLKRPNHHVAGLGYFVSHTRLPLATAWDVFGEQNGAPSLRALVELISTNRTERANPNTEIGCTVLTGVRFFRREQWIAVDSRFAPNIMVGRTFDTAVSEEARSLWQDTTTALESYAIRDASNLEQARYGREFLTRARLGQGSFRTLVIDAYQRKCAFTGESTLPALEAAHIRSFAEEGAHHVSNGLLLRSDFHKLFDAGLVTVEPDLRIRISGRIRDQYFNGKAYYRLDKQELTVLPTHGDDRPNPEFLRWHNNHRFVA